MPVCKNCHGTEFERDLSNANNDLVCKACGVVSEDNPIVSEVTFGETSAGAAVVQGSFIGAGQSHAAFGGSSALESREATLNNARRKLRAVSYALHIPEYITDAAFQWYKLALANNFVQGRRSQNVIASCLYVACRKEKTHHMLIDFSSRLQVSVYSIGATFLKMVKKLHITELPLADPSLFIQHFAEKLDLADKKIKVVKDAVKLAQRMSKDWMFEGRRPAGIAGACILLACRMNNLRRTHTEIVAVSHVAEETLQQRLNEFKNTKAAKLSVQKFRENDVEDGEARPPSFVKNRKKERKIKDSLDKEEMFQTSEEALNKNPILTQVLGEQELSSKEVLFYLKQFSERRARVVERIKATNGIDGENIYHEDSENETRERKLSETCIQDEHVEGEEKETEGTEEKVKKVKTKTSEEKKENESGHFQDAIDGYSLETDPYCPRNLHLLPTTDTYLSKVSDDPDNLEDVDDEELNAHLLNEEASKLKERIWIGLNADFLIEQESKRLKQEADIATGNTSVKKKRTRRRNNTRNDEPTKTVDAAAAIGLMSDLQDKSGLHAALKAAEESGDFTTADSVKNMLQKASFSKKINYDAIDGLFR
ncbi:CPS_HP_G0103490.mRNA.1.CDS.1 [Saccharomyces cerevisiae]|nr:CPS_HP_G0009500.mRNA.1.CDS.1 [Saccharomyces cerevisiae]CAI5017340.1 CPS_HP_G0089830.mRNA.1.CDS.1 [Saccharomyces cerevisiae]CAI5032276.1 CPS_HP_G0103490.mRNA.1.CDS.1 [Saccharomyces cerevisiae]CAI6381145.1 CPS_HP_G0009500.mRNA.1.CDS.1 [Saccharomyces cerevisiae]CAI6934822.1 CPS_HP_G0089830.mRNA.1.CDS.1 [Saccharomyces cerevisiae]